MASRSRSRFSLPPRSRLGRTVLVASTTMLLLVALVVTRRNLLARPPARVSFLAWKEVKPAEVLGTGS